MRTRKQKTANAILITLIAIVVIFSTIATDGAALVVIAILVLLIWAITNSNFEKEDK